MHGAGTLAALPPGVAGAVPALQRAAFVTEAQARQHSHANLRLYRRHGYRQTRTIQVGAYLLVHLAKARSRRPGAADSRLGCS